MSAYYNEIDPYAADWLRNLIRRGLIAPGDVDTRSIVDVRPDDLRGYTQCHFFAGIGVWSYALRRAGWPDERPVWTGSCPCQPFSAAGKGDGFADERHLWPFWHHLIRVCRPETVFGEQVASKDGLGWLDLVQSDMEGERYALWPVDLCAAGVGAPHIRQRLWFVGCSLDDMADANGRNTKQSAWQRAGSHEAQGRWPSSRSAGRGHFDLLEYDLSEGLEGQRSGHCASIGQRAGSIRSASEAGEFDWLGDAGGDGDRKHTRKLSGDESEYEVRSSDSDHASVASSSVGNLADASGSRTRRIAGTLSREKGAEAGWRADAFESFGAAGGMADSNGQQQRQGRNTGGPQGEGVRSEPSGRSFDLGRPSPTNGFWSDVDWLFCRDGKWRPVESGTFPLAHGAPARVGRLRAYGNAIVAEAAQTVIETYLEHESFGAFLDLTAEELTVEDLLG